VRNGSEMVGKLNELGIGAAIVAVGVALYFFTVRLQRKGIS